MNSCIVFFYTVNSPSVTYVQTCTPNMSQMKHNQPYMKHMRDWTSIIMVVGFLASSQSKKSLAERWPLKQPDSWLVYMGWVRTVMALCQL